MMSEEELLYKENVMDHYKFPRNKKVLEVFTQQHKELNPLCGDEITIYLHIKNNTLKDISFTGEGCAISQASISLLTEHLKGMSLQDAEKVTQDDIFNLLGIPISHTRMKCALLSLKALQGGLTQ